MNLAIGLSNNLIGTERATAHNLNKREFEFTDAHIRHNTSDHAWVDQWT